VVGGEEKDMYMKSQSFRGPGVKYLHIMRTENCVGLDKMKFHNKLSLEDQECRKGVRENEKENEDEREEVERMIVGNNECN
jgi:hypothetical protein